MLLKNVDDSLSVCDEGPKSKHNLLGTLVLTPILVRSTRCN